MITLINKETKETVVIRQLSLDEALGAARSEDEAEFLKSHLKSGDSCFSCTWECGAMEISIASGSEREFAKEEFQLEEDDTIWKIQASHLKLVS
ncbi:hypothetical protein P7M03_16745 [Vibrio parahaemolyticus]|nr:hypothetical protein [Vibrio parahaemolyticus]